MAQRTINITIDEREYTIKELSASDAVDVPPLLLKAFPVLEALQHGDFMKVLSNCDPKALKSVVMLLLHKTNNVLFDGKSIDVNEHFEGRLASLYKLFIEVAKFNFKDFFFDIVHFIADQVKNLSLQNP